jgi:hypothetical protein
MLKSESAGREENKTNPDSQARGYVYELMNVLKEYIRRDNKSGLYQGLKLIFSL